MSWGGRGMRLDELYGRVKSRIDDVDTESIWNGFHKLRFALYTDSECFFDGRYVEKTDAFLANTAIMYEGEHIAIWKISEDMDIDVLASKMVHEMFHAFQNIMGEKRWANEAVALNRYRYDPNNISAKIRENRLIAEIIHDFDGEMVGRLLAMRAARRNAFPYEYDYEARIEQIEGAAEYVEMAALNQLSPEKAEVHMEDALKRIVDVGSFLPVRIGCYTVGALILRILKKYAGDRFENFSDVPFAEEMLKGAVPATDELIADRDIAEKVDGFVRESRAVIEDGMANWRQILDGKYTLMGVNVYNARSWNNCWLSQGFLAYGEGDKNTVLYGDFIIVVDEELNIVRAYQK